MKRFLFYKLTSIAFAIMACRYFIISLGQKGLTELPDWWIFSTEITYWNGGACFLIAVAYFICWIIWYLLSLESFDKMKNTKNP